MRVLVRLFLFIAFLIVVPSLAYAAPLDLVLTQGISSAIPIAIVPFVGQTDPQSINNVSSIINNDLQNSGQFKPLDPQSMTQNPHTPSEVDLNYWRQAKANAVVVGSVTPEGDQFKVSFALVNIFGAQNQPATVLASQTFTVPENQLRPLAHHISDIIYQQLLGTRGIFSTKVAYVLVQRGAGMPPRYSLILADIDGYNPRRLLISPQPIMSPAWSHDGRQIAYVSFENVTPKIYVQDVATGSRRVVSGYPGINGAPAWSADDSKLAIVLSKNGSPKIYTMNLTGGDLQQLTQGSSIDTEPSWSPDGKSLLFTSDRGGGPQLYALNLSNGQVQRLTYNGPYNARGAYTADGKSIVMIHRENGDYNIGVQDLETGTVQVLTRSGYDASPSVAPNGKMVLYESGAGNQGILGMVSIDGKVRLRIPAQSGSVQDPAWSPFLS